MRQHKPRKAKPLFFDLRVYGREATIVEVKDQPVTKWHEVIGILEHKDAIPPKTPKQNIIEMIEKGL